ATGQDRAPAARGQEPLRGGWGRPGGDTRAGETGVGAEEDGGPAQSPPGGEAAGAAPWLDTLFASGLCPAPVAGEPGRESEQTAEGRSAGGGGGLATWGVAALLGAALGPARRRGQEEERA